MIFLQFLSSPFSDDSEVGGKESNMKINQRLLYYK